MLLYVVIVVCHKSTLPHSGGRDYTVRCCSFMPTGDSRLAAGAAMVDCPKLCQWLPHLPTQEDTRDQAEQWIGPFALYAVLRRE